MLPEAKGAYTPLNADQVVKADAAAAPSRPPAASSEPYAKTTADSTADTGKGAPRADDPPSQKPAHPDVVPSKGGGQNQ